MSRIHAAIYGLIWGGEPIFQKQSSYEAENEMETETTDYRGNASPLLMNKYSESSG